MIRREGFTHRWLVLRGVDVRVKPKYRIIYDIARHVMKTYIYFDIQESSCAICMYKYEWIAQGFIQSI